MSDILKEKFPDLQNLLTSFEELSLFNISYPGITTQKVLESPYQFFIQDLKTSNASNELIKRVQKYKPASSYKGENVQLKDLEKEIARILSDKVAPYIAKYKEFPSLTLREYRYLSRYYDFPEKSKTTYINFLDKLIEENKVTSRIFSNLIEVYFSKYNSFIHNEDLYQRLVKIWESYENKNARKNKWLQQITKNKNFYLSKDAAKSIAQSSLFTRKNKPDLTIHDIMNINVKNIHGDLLSETYKHLGFACFEKCKDGFYLDILLNEIISNSPISKKQLDEVVSKVILAFSDSSDVNSKIQEKIRKCILLHKEYGDPRINLTNWSNVDDKARKLFKNWLSKVDLEFFFNVIFDDVDDYQQRKLFWEQYIASLVNSRVIISTSHKQLNELELKKAKEEGRTFAEFVYDSQPSCFVMDFGKIYVVEFCESGNATYIYSKDALKLDLTKKKITENLKSSKKAHLVKMEDIFQSSNQKYIKEDLSALEEHKILRFRHQKDKYNFREKTMMIWHIMVILYLESIGIYPDK